jgi:hypothetical protein
MKLHVCKNCKKLKHYTDNEIYKYRCKHILISEVGTYKHSCNKFKIKSLWKLKSANFRTN